MKLSSLDHQLIAILERSPTSSAEEIARLAGLRPARVRNRLALMWTHGTYSVRPLIDIAKLGYLDLALYFSLGVSESAQRRSVEKIFSHLPGVSWHGALSGQFQYVATIYCRSLQHLLESLEPIEQSRGDIFSKKAIAPRVKVDFLPRKYLHPELTSKVTLASLGAFGSEVLDQCDHKILSGLANNTFTSWRELSRQIGVPIATFERRITLLKKRGILTGFFLNLNLDQFNRSSYKVLLSTRSLGGETTARIRNFCINHPLCTMVIQTVGAWDFELSIETTASDEIMRFEEELYEAAGYGITSSIIVQELRDLRFSLYPFVEMVGAVG